MQMIAGLPWFNYRMRVNPRLISLVFRATGIPCSAFMKATTRSKATLGDKRRSLRERGWGGASDIRWRPEPGSPSSRIVSCAQTSMTRAP